MAMQGLGFPSLSNLKTVPVFFNMIDNGDLDEPTFGLYLNPFPTAEPAGEIMFGGVNRSLFAGELFSVPVLVKTCETPSIDFWTAPACLKSVRAVAIAVQMFQTDAVSITPLCCSATSQAAC